MINRRYLYKYFVQILACVFLVGCSEEKIIDGAVGKEEALKGNINVWCSKDSEKSLKHSAALFTEKNPGVTVKVTPMLKEEYEKKLISEETLAGELPHIIEVDTYRIPQLVADFSEIFKPVDNELANFRSKILPWKLKEVTLEGRAYALPWNTSPKVILYNKDIANKYNIDPFSIKTWSQFLEAGNAVKERSEGNTKLIALKEVVDGDLYTSMMRQQGNSLYINDSKVRLPRDENISALAIMGDLYNQQLVHELKIGEDPLTTASTGKALCIIADGSIINRIINSEELRLQQWQIERFPAFEYGGKSTAGDEGNALMLTKFNENSGLAASFVTFMLTDKECNVFALKSSGIIPSITEIYSLPLFNSIDDNFNGLRVWRFMAELSKEEREFMYDKEYVRVEAELRKLEQAAINGQDVEVLIKLHEEELNKVSQ